MKFETKFELGMKPWCLACGTNEVFQDEEPITEIRISIMEGHLFEEPLWGEIPTRKEYKLTPYPTREEAKNALIRYLEGLEK